MAAGSLSSSSTTFPGAARGTRSARTTASTAQRRSKAAVPARILGPRLLFILTTIALLIFGLVMVYSASFVEAFTNPNIQDGAYIFQRQLMLVGLGLVALTVAAALDYRVWNSPLAWVPWAIVVVLLALTLVMGNEELGGKRWFDLFGFNLQPSEFAKIALLLVVGMLLIKLHQSSDRIPIMGLMAGAIVVPILLILLQPDLGTTLIALAGIVAVAWFGELSMKPIAIAVGLIVLVGASAILFTDFRVDRIESWLDPWAYASDGGYQIINSFYAFADGGLTGVSLGMSHQKYLYLPQPHNDLIFPIIGEEFGLIGTASVVVLFVLFLYSAYRIARGANDLYGRVLVGASATLIGFQAFLNMLCMVNLLPMTGKPLPFFSAGGSSIIVTLILVGLILNVSLRSNPSNDAEKRRDDLLIIEGGRGATQRSNTWPHLAGGIFPTKQFRKQPARATSPAAKGQALRKAPARPPTQASHLPVKPAQGSARGGRPPAQPANPLLSMNPARSRAAARPTGASTSTRGHAVRHSAPNKSTTTRSSAVSKPHKPAANKPAPSRPSIKATSAKTPNKPNKPALSRPSIKPTSIKPTPARASAGSSRRGSALR
jgi:cell division protein FtsW